MSISRLASTLWHWLTEPAASIQEPEERQRARIVAAILLLAIVLIFVSLLQYARLRDAFYPWVLMLAGVTIAYGFSRTRFYRLGTLIAIVVLWLLPTFIVVALGFANMVTLILSIGRLLLLSLLLAYILASLRASIVLALCMLVTFMVAPASATSSAPPLQRAADFVLASGSIFFILVIMRQYDLTQRQQAETERRATEERYRAIVEIQTELVVRWLPDETLTFVNDAYCRSFGRSREALIGTKFNENVYPDDLHIIRSAIKNVTPEKPTVTYEHRVLLAGGAVGWHQWTDYAIFDERGTIVEYQSVGHDITERKITEAALSASEAHYRAIVEIQTEMICRWLPDETLTFANEACCRYFGRTRDDMIGRKVLAPVYEDDLPHVKSMIARMNREQPSVTYEFRMVNPAGEVRWHQWTDQAIFNDDGEIVEYQSVGRDITELKRAEEAEHEQREFAEALTNTAALISSTLNLDEVLDRILNRVAAVNPLTSAEILLINSGVAYIVRTRGYISPEDREGVMKLRFPVHETKNLRTMLETGKPLIIADVRDDPEWLDFEVSHWIRASCGSPIRLEGETIGFLSMTSEIPGIFTEQHAERLQAFADQAAIAIRNARLYAEVRRQAEEFESLVKQRTAELELERQRLRAILDGTGEGMFYTEDERIQFANVAFCKLTGYTQDELVGKSYLQLYDSEASPDTSRILDSARIEVRDQGVWRGEFHIRRKDGSLCDAGLTISLIGSSAARPFRAVTVVRDISREKALQLQRSNLIAYASHELRTPLTNMKTRLYLLRRRPELLDEHLVVLDEVTERMRQLISDLLDMSRLEHGLVPLRREDVTVQGVVQTVVALQKPEAERSSLDLRWTLPDEPIRVSADRERLIQVVSNLVTNAINYTPAGGAVSITVEQQENCATIAVEDTGIGIAAENLPHIFQPFYRVVSEVEGTGLGLSISKTIVEQHGGSLSVSSTPHQGSVFTIRLPLLDTIRIG